MGFYTRKVIFGFILSLIGIAASFAWYRFDLSKHKGEDNENRKTVARLSFIKNEVQKKQAKRVIWQKVGEEEVLRVGEAIRTSSDSEAEISFISGAQINMDPDSVVVIEESGDKINLDFVKGNLLFKGGDPKNSELGLKSGNTSIALGNADMTFNKSARGGGVDVQVLRGTAELDQNGKKLTLDQSKSGLIDENGVSVTNQFFKIKSPLSFSKSYVRVDKKEPVIFEWDPLDPVYDVYLELGKTREKLERMVPKVSGKSGTLASQIKIGNYFWRLVAINSKDTSKVYYSPTTKLTVVSEVPPQLISPVNGELTTFSLDTKLLPLRWTNPSRLEKLHVEISRDPQFRRNDYSEAVDASGLHQALLEADGTYYWRVIGFRSGTAKEVSSDVQKFVYNTQIKLIPPELKSPLNNSRISAESIISGGFFLSWAPVLGIKQFNIKITDGVGKIVYESKVSDATQVKFDQTKPGQYKWSIVSVDHEGKQSQVSMQRTFWVENLPVLRWADEKEQETYFYSTDKPQLRVIVKPVAGAKNYRIGVRLSDKATEEAKKTDSQGPDKIIDVPSDGNYETFVEALNASGQIIAKSKNKNFIVQPRPLLPPPEFAANFPGGLTAQKNGSANFSFKSVNGAKSYIVNIKQDNGKLMSSQKFSTTTVTLRNLLPGSYKVSLSSVDDHGRAGPNGYDKALVVPFVSDSKAPKFKRLKVK